MEHELATKVYQVVSLFMKKISTVERLEKYYYDNKVELNLMRKAAPSLYDDLIEEFKLKKQEIIRKEQCQ
tara:strand:- start:3211 stop:3420 length:210 start_codon:yes stop_codon:yes gene_type:complete